MLKEIKAGEKYADEAGDIVTVLHIEGDEAVCSWREEEGLRAAVIPVAACLIWSYPPKEPKKLGQLYMCNNGYESNGISHDFGDICVFDEETAFTTENWQPVAINDKGEVFSVE